MSCRWFRTFRFFFPHSKKPCALYLGDVEETNALENELRHAVANIDHKRHVRVIEQDDAHVAAVVRIDNACARVDEMLPR